MTLQCADTLLDYVRHLHGLNTVTSQLQEKSELSWKGKLAVLKTRKKTKNIMDY
jgi:hypothetical protein